MDEAIPHFLGELSGFSLLITLHDPIILQVGYRVQQSTSHLPDKPFLHPFVLPYGPYDIFAATEKK